MSGAIDHLQNTIGVTKLVTSDIEEVFKQQVLEPKKKNLGKTPNLNKSPIKYHVRLKNSMRKTLIQDGLT